MDYEEAKRRREALRLKERKLTRGNWEASVGAVNCMNERHKIVVTPKGRLVLPNHRGQSIEEISAMLIFNPEVRCRCMEVKKIWKWYTGVVSPNFYSLREKEPWITDLFLDRSGYFSTPSNSRLLSYLPVGLRDAAERHKQAGGTRKHQYYPLPPAVPISKRLPSSRERNQYRQEVCLKRAKRVLLQDPVFVNSREEGMDIVKNFDLGYTFKRNMADQTDFFKPWFRAINRVGVYPGQLPPSFMWDTDSEGRHYPTILKGWACTGQFSEYSKEWRVQEIWVKVRWSDQHGYVVERERFATPGGQ